VIDSRRYTDPATLLLLSERWAAQRDDFHSVIGTDANSRQQLERREDQLHAALAALEVVRAEPPDEGLARLSKDRELITSPLPAELVPADAEATPW
jgi:outer membrane protein TolC